MRERRDRRLTTRRAADVAPQILRSSLRLSRSTQSFCALPAPHWRRARSASRSARPRASCTARAHPGRSDASPARGERHPSISGASRSRCSMRRARPRPDASNETTWFTFHTSERPRRIGSSEVSGACARARWNIVRWARVRCAAATERDHGACVIGSRRSPNHLRASSVLQLSAADTDLTNWRKT